MKYMKRILPLFLALVVLLAFLVSCSGSDSGASSMPEENYGVSIGTGTNSVIDDRKIIREYEITLETKEFNKSIADLRAAVAAVNGYEEGASVTPSTGEQTGSAYIVFRIPTEKIDVFNQSIEGIGSIAQQEISSKDVTLTYADVEARIKSLEAEQARLLELYEQAKNTTETMNIYQRLTEVESDLNSYRAQLTKMEGQITMTSYTFRVRDVKEYTHETNFFVRIGQAILGSLDAFWGFIQIFVIALIYVVPFAIFFGLIITGIIHLINRKNMKRRREEKRAARAAQQEAASDAETPAVTTSETPSEETPPTQSKLYGVDEE